MNNFNLTDKRKKEIKEMLIKQYSVGYIANHLGVSRSTLSEKLKEARINVKKYKAIGINTLKADALATIYEIDEPDKRHKASMDFLKHYDISDDVARAKQDISADVKIDTNGLADRLIGKGK